MKRVWKAVLTLSESSLNPEIEQLGVGKYVDLEIIKEIAWDCKYSFLGKG